MAVPRSECCIRLFRDPGNGSKWCIHHGISGELQRLDGIDCVVHFDDRGNGYVSVAANGEAKTTWLKDSFTIALGRARGLFFPTAGHSGELYCPSWAAATVIRKEFNQH